MSWDSQHYVFIIKNPSLAPYQGWEFVNLLIFSSLICSFAHRSFTHLLIRSSLIHSFAHLLFRSNKMSDCERFAQIARDKWATVRKSLRSLKTNERPWAIRSGFSEEMSDLLKKCWLKKSKILFYYVLLNFFFLWANSSFSLISSFLWAMWMSRSFCSNQMSDVSESLISLRGNEQLWANHSGHSRQMSDHEWFAQVAQRKGANERFAQKIFAKKSKILLYYVLVKIFFFLQKNELIAFFAHFLLFGEQCEWMAHFAQIKSAMWANCSFRSPKMSDHERFAQVAQRKWAMWANRSFCSPKMSKWVNRSCFWANRSCFWANCSFAHFWTKNKRFAWK